ncbi:MULTISPECIES: sensor histidine kinase [Bacillus]|uniref:sensor histidine kinase n=1 Tax=Bacillus TaxID=1386 RepID=UPI001CD226DC|nr:sensor histidine kinase [Bacillus amyloliquefaciens]
MGTMKYKISSRTALLLGRESVSKVEGAIIELVKNTYDADSDLCYIYFDQLNDSLYILDNGVGMTKEIIENCWMIIGTDNKRENYKSKKNRIKSGEKGIGRFALDRLGSKCEMLTKNFKEQLILWKNDWTEFEETGKTIDEIEAEFDYLDLNFIDIIPEEILENIHALEKSLNIKYNMETGTIIKISDLRDIWTAEKIDGLFDSLGFLIPPSEQKEYVICVQKSPSEKHIVIENQISDEFDYRLNAEFDGEQFKVFLYRNEYDLDVIPNELFELEEFQIHPFKKEDFKAKEILIEQSISQLLKTSSEKEIEKAKKVGPFKFEYTFMKLGLTAKDKKMFFYKEISKNRNDWMDLHNGIKIYRDNFLVRPYGDQKSDSFDWLGIDAKRANNPTAVASKSGRWNVRNKQGQGTIFISRVLNDKISDKSSREGLIENEYFTIFKEMILGIIALFEQDRAYIARNMKKFNQVINQKEKTKQEANKIAKEIIEKKRQTETNFLKFIKTKATTETETETETQTETETLAKAVEYYREEREELISEIKLLRELATNGLITTSIVHDLKTIRANLTSRVEVIRRSIDNNPNILERSLNDLERSDVFLKSWISVIINQKKDRRKRTKKNLTETIKSIVNLINPILSQKNIIVDIKSDNQVYKKIFSSDFESIIYNLIINSIESFEKRSPKERKIFINLKALEKEFILLYKDNGKGLDDIFQDPNEIFNYGVTSKCDRNGVKIGTGLGMYIVAATLREYDAKYKIIESSNGFGLEMKFKI